MKKKQRLVEILSNFLHLNIIVGNSLKNYRKLKLLQLHRTQL